MKADELSLTLVPSSDEPSISSPSTQAEFRSFLDALHQHSMEANPHAIVRKSGGEGWSFFGEFSIPIATAVVSALGLVIAAWFQGRAGRKVQIKIGDVEAEAGTSKEVKKLLQHVQEYKASLERRDEPKP